MSGRVRLAHASKRVTGLVAGSRASGSHARLARAAEGAKRGVWLWTGARDAAWAGGHRPQRDPHLRPGARRHPLTGGYFDLHVSGWRLG